MKAMILAGGYGTRLSEETHARPKPMVEIGGRPILWHIMKLYSYHGISQFVICLGYKADHIKKFFLDYSSTMSDFTIDLSDQKLVLHNKRSEPWKVTLIDTGLDTMTGGRIKKAIDFLDPSEDFCLTYGDGLSNTDISTTIDFHKKHGKLCTITTVTPPGRFGVLDITQENKVTGFREKVDSDQYRINAGFFVLNEKVKDYIADDSTVWEQEPMENLAKDGEVMAWNHTGFWHPMDTLRDKHYLEKLWRTGAAPWTYLK